MDFLKLILGMKIGHLLLIIGAILLGGSLIKNIFTGTFSVTKFFSGFNIFAGGVQGKLIYYGLIIFACFLVYHFVMRPTYSYDTDYKNQIHHNQDVFLDQTVGAKGCDVDLFFGLIKFGCNPKSMTKTVNNNCNCEGIKK